jgi:hypothetical protein
MCLSVEEWKFINTFAPWFSAIGTFLAVCVSLYISYSTRKIALKIDSGIYKRLNGEGACEEYLGIYVTNTGYRTVFLNSSATISFQVGWFKKKTILIRNKYIADQSSNFPCKLGENETAHLFVKINNNDNNINWIQNFNDEFLKNYSLSTLKIIVFPNVGKPFKVKPAKDIMKEFTKSRQKIKKL